MIKGSRSGDIEQHYSQKKECFSAVKKDPKMKKTGK